MENRTCKNCKKDFTVEPDDFSFYEKIGVPAPTFCFRCRLARKMMWRNERTFYSRPCDLCGKNFVSTYDTDVAFPVYCQKCWWSDGWDAYEYGVDFDFSRPFFEQWKELLDRVPMIGFMNDDGVGSVNSPYAYDFSFSKNVFLSAAGWHVENVFYSYYTCTDKDVVDIYMLNNGELCYQCIESHGSSRCIYSINTLDSVDCSFCFDIKNCLNCFLCTGLRNKSYCIKNIQYSKEEYQKIVASYALHTRSGIVRAKKERDELMQFSPRRYAYIIQSTPDVTGHMLFEAKNSRECFWAGNGIENSKYLVNIDGCKDSYDLVNTGKMEMCYECVTPDESYRERFCIFCWKCSYTDYSYNCHGASNIFGSIGLKKGEYSIFNKRYTKDEFEILRDKIVAHMKKTGEWGEFFPMAISPFAYNETQAFEYFPLSLNKVRAKNLRWKEQKERGYAVDIYAEALPDSFVDTEEYIGKVVECAHKGSCDHVCSTAFRITEYEARFYKRMHLPIPDTCPNCRHYERLSYRLPPLLYKRECACAHETHGHAGKCARSFETPYSPDRPEIVYCESCYQKEIL